MTRGSVRTVAVEVVDQAKSCRALEGHGDDLGFYSEYDGKPVEDSEQRDDMVKLLSFSICAAEASTKLLSFKDHADCCGGQSHHCSRGVVGRPTKRPLLQSMGEAMVALTRLVAIG